MGEILVVVPCGRRKIWDQEPGRGAAPARDAYIGMPFRRNREYAERFGDGWVILSAKYGFIEPDFTIPTAYDVTFQNRSTQPVDAATLKEQVRAQRLDQFEKIVALGGRTYRSLIEEAFQKSHVAVVSPFAGLPIGKYIQAVSQATVTGDSRI